MTFDPYWEWRQTQRRAKSLPRKGKLGYFIDGALRVKVENHPALFYVRFPDNSYRRLLHRGHIRPEPNVDVRLGKDVDGVYCILGEDTAQADALQATFGGKLLTPEHDHTAAEITDLGDVALLHADFAAAEGLMHKVSAGVYETLKTNLAASGAPTASDDDSAGYAKFSVWFYGGHLWVCTDASTSAAVWVQIDGGGAASEKIFTVEGALTVTTNPLRIYNISGTSRTIDRVFISVATPPTGADIIVDVLINGTTIFTGGTNRPVIAVSANTGDTTTIDVPTWADGDYLQMRIAQVGSTVPGAYLSVQVRYM